MNVVLLENGLLTIRTQLRVTDQEVVEKVSSFREDKVVLLEVVWVQSSANQINCSNEVLFHNCVLRW